MPLNDKAVKQAADAMIKWETNSAIKWLQKSYEYSLAQARIMVGQALDSEAAPDYITLARIAIKTYKRETTEADHDSP